MSRTPKIHKTFIVTEGDTDDTMHHHGTTPCLRTLALTREIHRPREQVFTPLQLFPTTDARTVVTRDMICMNMWLLSEKPRTVQLFGNMDEIPSDLEGIRLPESVTLKYRNVNSTDWETVQCNVFGTNLALPSFSAYPLEIKFDASLV